MNMLWSEFKKLSTVEKAKAMSTTRNQTRAFKRLFDNIFSESIEIPFEETELKAAWMAWGYYSSIGSQEEMLDFLSQFIEVDGKTFSASKVALSGAQKWPHFFFGFKNGRSEFVPGLIPVLMMDEADDPLQGFLLSTDFSGMTLKEAAFEFRKIQNCSSDSRFRKRVNSW